MIQNRLFSFLAIVLWLPILSIPRMWAQGAPVPTEKSDILVHKDDFGDDPNQPYVDEPAYENIPRHIPRENQEESNSESTLNAHDPAPSRDAPDPNSHSAPRSDSRTDLNPPAANPSPIKNRGGILDWLMREGGGSGAEPGTRHWIGPSRNGRRSDRTANQEADQRDEYDLRRYSLWTGLNAPMALPADKVSQVSPAQALVEGRADYSRKILGERDAVASIPDRPSLRGAAGAKISAGSGAETSLIPLQEKSISASAKLQGMFIGLEMDISRRPGEYRDAVAQLSDSAGFTVDYRFPPVFPNDKKDKVRLWGWIPSGQLHSVVNVPNVMRLEIDQAPPQEASRYSASQARMLLALRLPPLMLPKQMVDASAARWAREDGFVLERTIGIQRIPHSSDNAVIVAGRLPVRNLGKLLADPAVVKMMPSPGPEPRRRERESVPVSQASIPAGFLSDLAERYPVPAFLALLLAAYVIRISRKTGRRAASPTQLRG